MKYRNNFCASALKGRVAAFALAVFAALLALPGVGPLDAARVNAAQEKTGKPPRSTRLDGLRAEGASARPAGRLGRKKSAKPAQELSGGQTASLLACDQTGTGTAIALNTTANGALTLDDCDFGDNTRFDVFRFDGSAGQQVSIALNSTAFDAYLFLVFDDNFNGVLDGADIEVGEDDDGAGVVGGNARIPSGSGVATLPLSGRYFIIVNSFPPNTGQPVPTGNYSLTLTGGSQCAPTATTPGGGAINNSLGSGDCRFVDDSFFDLYSFSGTAGQQISITYAPAFDGIVYLLDASRTILAVDGGLGGSFNARIPASGFVTLPTTGTYFVAAGSVPRPDPGTPTPTGSYTLTIANGGQCPSAPITTGQTINNSLNLGECTLTDGSLVDFYTFTGTAGQEVAISLSSTAFDAFLFLNGPAGTVVAEDDDGGGGPTGLDSRIPAGSGFFTLPATGTYTILANTFPPGPGQPSPTGNYTLSLTGNIPPASDVQFAATSLSATEGTDRSVLVNVTRTGVTTGESFVSFATTDGTTNERRDYTIALGRLRFAAGETNKSFEVVITDDAFAEGPETFSITLSNPVGATLGAQSTATVTITSNDAANGPSPVRDASFNAEFFVRQHYADFLGRVPDQDGLNFWVGQTSFCGSPDPLVCRINTSAAFFLSIENQETGYLTHRAYRVAFGNLPGKPVPLTLREYIAGSRQIADGVRVGIGNWQQVLEANKVAFFNEFVTTTRFTTIYNGLTNTQYVDALNANASGALDANERTTLINALTGGTMTRAQALRRVAEDADFAGDGRPEKSRAFVLAQYFGYLRRNPDDPDFRGIPDPNFEGYNFWLGKLNEFNGNFVQAEMVKAFIQSIEYGDRFGQ